MIRENRSPRLLPFAVAGLLTLALAGGCAASSSVQQENAALPDLQETVLEISQAAANGDFSSARNLLERLEGELQAAAAEGTISFARYLSISKALEGVKAETNARIAASTTLSA